MRTVDVFILGAVISIKPLFVCIIRNNGIKYLHVLSACRNYRHWLKYIHNQCYSRSGAQDIFYRWSKKWFYPPPHKLKIILFHTFYHNLILVNISINQCNLWLMMNIFQLIFKVWLHLVIGLGATGYRYILHPYEYEA